MISNCIIIEHRLCNRKHIPPVPSLEIQAENRNDLSNDSRQQKGALSWPLHHWFYWSSRRCPNAFLIRAWPAANLTSNNTYVRMRRDGIVNKRCAHIFSRAASLHWLLPQTLLTSTRNHCRLSLIMGYEQIIKCKILAKFLVPQGIPGYWNPGGQGQPRRPVQSQQPKVRGS